MTIFADESGTSAGSPCYTIGLLNIPNNFHDEFNNEIESIHKRSGMQGEIKWEKVRKSAGQINLCSNILKFILKSPCSFHSIAVSKKPYRKWSEDSEKAFFTTYDLLLKRCCAGFDAEHKVIIDQLSTSYSKQSEVMQIITNHMLAKLPTSSTVEQLTMENSKFEYGLQAADILTGAVNSGYQLFFNDSTQMQLAKKLAIEKVANTLGWDKLHYDTMPNIDFNIWHFPIETRAVPATMKVIPDFSISEMTREEYEYLLTHPKW